MSDLQTLRTELTALKSVVDGHSNMVSEFTESSRFQLSEQNRRIEGVETSIDTLRSDLNTKIDTLRSDLEGKIAHSQTVVIGVIGGVGVVLAAMQLLFR